MGNPLVSFSAFIRRHIVALLLTFGALLFLLLLSQVAGVSLAAWLYGLDGTALCALTP